jgi:hypothetical protein
MAQGSLEAKGSGVGFEGIGADIKPLLKAIRAAAQTGKRSEGANTDSSKRWQPIQKGNDREHTGRSRGNPNTQGQRARRLDIKTGTLRRSIKVWQIDKRFSTFWVGPRVGRRAPKDADGWFANIVEGGDQKFGGNKQKGLFARSIANTRGAALTAMKKKYDFQIRKAAREKAKKQKK